jgi:hypothetical protein
MFALLVRTPFSAQDESVWCGICAEEMSAVNLWVSKCSWPSFRHACCILKEFPSIEEAQAQMVYLDQGF